MNSTLRLAGLVALATAAACQPAAAPSHSPSPASLPAMPSPERVVQREIPITNAIRRALAAGTRDSTGRPTSRYWQLRTDYTIDARLDSATSRITGRERIVLHNASPDSLPYIRLRLDPNIFLANTPKAAPWVPAELTDGMVITRLAVNGVVATLDGRTGQQPVQVPTVSGIRTTNARIDLPAAIAAGATATIDIEWNHKLPGGPGVGHRMTQRWADTLYQPTQWYPRVANYDDLRGWDTELYLGPSEFYNNFGRFDVRIDVPAGWLVSGTGILQNPEQVLTPAVRERLARVLGSDTVTTIVGANETGAGRATVPAPAGGRLVWHYRAENVNDFAWATARNFMWRATRATIPGKGAVPVHMFHLPGRANLFADAGGITRHALEFYSRLWFPYEFPQLTLQDGPSAGMEYPMVINSNRGAADHESFHQWIPMVVGTNETVYGWMDEGPNQYSNVLSDADAAGRPAVLDRMGQDYGRLVQGSESEPPMMWNANYAGPMYGFVTYSKTPMMLSSLGGVVGDSAVQRGLREWAVAWKWKHPSPWDFMFSMNRSLGRDLGWFWNAWLFETQSVDGSIAGVDVRGTEAHVRVHQAGAMPSPVVLQVSLASPATRTMSNAVMTGATTAVITWPVDVWFGGSRTFDAVIDLGAPVEAVQLDPGRRFPDRNPDDNGWKRN